MPLLENDQISWTILKKMATVLFIRGLTDASADRKFEIINTQGKFEKSDLKINYCQFVGWRKKCKIKLSYKQNRRHNITQNTCAATFSQLVFMRHCILLTCIHASLHSPNYFVASSHKVSNFSALPALTAIIRTVSPSLKCEAKPQ